MPIDPGIALSVRPAQIPDPLESYARLMQIQHAKAMQPLQEQALQQQIATQRESTSALADERRSVIAQHEQDLAQKQRVQQSQETIDRLMSSAMVEDPTTGVSTFDRAAFEKGLIQGGLGHLYPQLDETLNKLDQSQLKINSERNQSVARSIFAVQQAGNTPSAVQMAAAYLKKNRLIDDSHLQPVLDAVHQDESPENIARVMQALGQWMPEYQTLVNAEETRKAALGKTTAETQKITAEAENLKKYGRPTAPEPPSLQLHPTLVNGRETMTTFDPKAGTLMAGGQDVTSTAKPIPPASVQYPKPEDEGLALSAAGLDAAAVNYAKTATLPPMGMGKQGAAIRTKIINRAAELFPGLDLASNKAGFAADQGALTQLQKQRDAIGAFEQTAGKNIDVFLKSAGKVVDTGSPLANSVARMISGKMLGSEDQAAYDAARQVAINEIAKITSNPNLSGSLSDSARHEVDAFNPKDATLKQTVAVMRLLKQDMTNRTAAMDEQLKAIKGRIKGGSDSAPAAAPAGPSGVFSYQDYLKQKGGK